ncbi:MAG: hypothetical protein A4S12_06890 [Proteobacteria bacterium SG_bin5]|nr:hypothetical protein [Sphingomonas sp.]OQW42059.1 MAG: hypothetical protein A4S12_06890 [Proteobacteria bacterium SG_bin5]
MSRFLAIYQDEWCAQRAAILENVPPGVITSRRVDGHEMALPDYDSAAILVELPDGDFKPILIDLDTREQVSPVVIDWPNRFGDPD